MNMDINEKELKKGDMKMYEFFNGLIVGFIETAKVGIQVVVSVGTIVGEIFKESKEIYNELDD